MIRAYNITSSHIHHVCAYVVLLGDCIAASGTLAISERLDVSLLVSLGPGQWYQHRTREAILVLVSYTACGSLLRRLGK